MCKNRNSEKNLSETALCINSHFMVVANECLEAKITPTEINELDQHSQKTGNHLWWPEQSRLHQNELLSDQSCSALF